MRQRHIGIMLELMWPYRRHLEVFAGVQRYAKEADWQCELDEFIQASLGTRTAHGRRYDGLIARANDDLARRARRAGLPLVNVWFNSPSRAKLPGVFPDFAELGRLAGEHLCDRGYRHFACISCRAEEAHQIMTESFHALVQVHDSPCHCVRTTRSYYRNAASWTRFQSRLDQWIASWSLPVGVFVAYNDVTARYVVNACRRRGLRVPEDVAIVTPSDEPMIGVMPPPSLSSVEVNYEQVGYKAASMLDGLLSGKRTTQHIYLKPSGIIARDSTDFFAVDDPVVAAAMRFIEKNTRHKIDVNAVAAAACVSRRTLERRFLDTAGRSVAREIRRLRILKARRLLAETELLVKQVAEESGFGDPIRLHEVFIREVGMSPSDYRHRALTGTHLQRRTARA
ncbi:MAG: substrate-binding domain-containing protein [Phycisphaeraceae bacterium]